MSTLNNATEIHQENAQKNIIDLRSAINIFTQQEIIIYAGFLAGINSSGKLLLPLSWEFIKTA